MALVTVNGAGASGPVYSVRGGFDSWGDTRQPPASANAPGTLREWTSQFDRLNTGSVLNACGQAGFRVDEIVSDIATSGLIAASPGAEISVLLGGTNDLTQATVATAADVTAFANTMLNRWASWVAEVGTRKHAICTIPPPARSGALKEQARNAANARLLAGELGPDVYPINLDPWLLDETSPTAWKTSPDYEALNVGGPDSGLPSDHPNELCAEIIFDAINVNGLQRYSKMATIGLAPGDTGHNTANVVSINQYKEQIIAAARAKIIPAGSNVNTIGIRANGSIRTVQVALYPSTGGDPTGESPTILGVLDLTGGASPDTFTLAVDVDISTEQEYVLGVCESSGAVNFQCCEAFAVTGIGAAHVEDTNPVQINTAPDPFTSTATGNQDFVIWAEYTEPSGRQAVTGGVGDATTTPARDNGGDVAITPVGGVSSSIIGACPNEAYSEGPIMTEYAGGRPTTMAADHVFRYIGGGASTANETGSPSGPDTEVTHEARIYDAETDTFGSKAIRQVLANDSADPYAPGAAVAPSTFLNDTNPEEDVEAGEGVFGVAP